MKTALHLIHTIHPRAAWIAPLRRPTTDPYLAVPSFSHSRAVYMAPFGGNNYKRISRTNTTTIRHLVPVLSYLINCRRAIDSKVSGCQLRPKTQMTNTIRLPH